MKDGFPASSAPVKYKTKAMKATTPTQQQPLKRSSSRSSSGSKKHKDHPLETSSSGSGQYEGLGLYVKSTKISLSSTTSSSRGSSPKLAIDPMKQGLLWTTYGIRSILDDNDVTVMITYFKYNFQYISTLKTLSRRSYLLILVNYLLYISNHHHSRQNLAFAHLGSGYC